MSLLGRVISSNLIVKPKSSSILCGLPRNLQTKPKSRITSYILNKYVSLVKSYEITLKKNFPGAVKFYQVFSVGIKYFKNDTMILFKAFTKVTTKGLESLSRKELEIYYEMPKDMITVAPMLIIGSGVPFCSFIFVIAYFFPRTMLTHHFWSLQQKSEFSLMNHRKKLQCYKPVLRCMQKRLYLLEKDPLFIPLRNILECLGSGVHPNVELILSCKSLFVAQPYGLQHLPRNHVVNLLKLHDMHRGWRRRTRLEQRAYFIQLLDAAVMKEGGVSRLNQDEIKWQCFFRGLNPINMRNEDISTWLNTWLSISQHVDEDSYSLLLHCPILLGYNQPSNWWLLHYKRR